MSKAKDDKKNLDMLLGLSGLSGNVLPEDDTSTLELAKPLFDDNLDDIEKKCTSDAKKLIMQAIKHIFTKKMIKENPYIKDKLDIDIESLSGMLYQNRCAVLMQKTLMNEIKMGAATPRHFEVFSNLNKSIADNNKQLLGTVEAIKITYQGIINDIREKESYMSHDNTPLLENNNGDVIPQDGAVPSLMSKDFIKMVKSAVSKVKNDEV